MKCEWETIAFGDLLEEPVRNGLTKPKAIRGTGVKMIAMGEIFAYSRIADVVTDRVPVTEKELQNCSIKPLDILFARQSLTLEGAGKCSIITNVLEDTVFESHLIRTRVNQRKADPFFLYYYFNSPHGKENIKSIVEQVAAAGIRGSDLVKLSVSYPCLEKQRKISAILRSLDDKIELNNKINKNLQQQAFALFNKLMVGSGNAEWQTSDIAYLNPKRPLSKNQVARCIDMSQLSTTGAFPSGWEMKPFTGGMRFANGDTLLARITPCLENGKTAFIDFLNENEVAFGSTEYIVLAPKDGIPAEFLYCLARYPAFVEYAVKNMNGSSGRQRVSAETIGQFVLPEVSKSDLSVFGTSVTPMFRKMRCNSFENLRLAAIRDALLPKLMNGEIEIDQ